MTDDDLTHLSAAEIEALRQYREAERRAIVDHLAGLLWCYPAAQPPEEEIERLGAEWLELTRGDVELAVAAARAAEREEAGE